jgi:geranylgeranyl diphosphate synthase, type II
MSARQNKIISDDLSSYIAEARPYIERALRQHLPVARAGAVGRFNEALHYVLFPGGKRIRPILTLLGSEIVGGRRGDVLSAATAVEYIHNSSLIFDDLPCMDDASARRGRIPLHQRYGEGVSILVALDLMNAAYGLVLKNPECESEINIRACQELVECIGPNGMLGGQAIDLAGVINSTPRDRWPNFEELRNQKTSALIRLSLRIGAILTGASQSHLATLSHFAELLGNAYQISDDLLDQEEDSPRTDNGEMLASPESRAERFSCRVEDLISQAKHIIETEFCWSRPSELLCQVADYVGDRISRSRRQAPELSISANVLSPS